MTLQERVCAELRLRLAVLPAETAAWLRRVQDAKDGWGIHLSQIEAFRVTMNVLYEKQTEKYKKVEKAISPDAFAQSYESLCREMVAVQELWRVFRSLLDQRERIERPTSPEVGKGRRLFRSLLGWRRQRAQGAYLPLLDAADLIAADCYNSGVKRPRDEWDILRADRCREPPLVYWEADDSPATVSRGLAVGALDSRVRHYRFQRLPVPVIAIPYDYAACLWLLSFLAHEVGHNLDQDLNLSRALTEQLDQALTKAQSPGLEVRRAVWRNWTAELLADALGILFGGLGFALSLADLLQTIAPLLPGSSAEKPHPHPRLRVRLLAAMLRSCGIPDWTTAAEQLERSESNLPEVLQGYTTDVEIVGETCLKAPLAPLRGHALCELNPELKADARKALDLAAFFNDRGPRPAPERFLFRLVPGATRLALMDNPDGAALHAKGQEFLSAIQPPVFLAPSTDRTRFFQELARTLSPDPE
jgi:hypothetical protein